MAEDIKAQLKDLYYRKYEEPQDINGSAYGYISRIIDVLYGIMRGAGPSDSADKEMLELSRLLLDRGGPAGINCLADCYQDITHKQSRKKKGQFYTPEYLAGFMIDKLLEKVDIVENPGITIFDPSCGGGIFLIKAYERLRLALLENLPLIKSRHPRLDLDDRNIDSFVIGNLYGIDSDELGVKLAKLQLCHASGNCPDGSVNIVEGDMLTAGTFPWGDVSFDIIVGNPPYIGHKKLSGKYRRELRKLYPGILTDKADVYYCFIKSSIDLLKKGGHLSFIISRYIAEAPGAEGIRKFLMDTGTMEEIIDFYGNRSLDGIQVDPMIFMYRKDDTAVVSPDTRVFRVNDLNITGRELIDRIKSGREDGYTAYEVSPAHMRHDGWRLLPGSHIRIIEKIESQCNFLLGDLVCSFQGIITGYDQAFIIEKREAEDRALPEGIAKEWIKNSHIQKYHIKASDKRLVYTNCIGDLGEYPWIEQHLLPYKKRLEKRRECIRGVRKWYELQWGRTMDNFETDKVVYPYKSSLNRFALDRRNVYFSADVYSFYLKQQYNSLISLEYLVGLLNSRLYDFYFKCLGKKLGMDMYEYYPNTVMRLGIKLGNTGRIVRMVGELTDGSHSTGLAAQKDLNSAVYEMFGLTREETDIVERHYKKDCG